MDISDDPSAETLNGRMVILLNQMFAPVTPIEALQVSMSRPDGGRTNLIYIATVDPAPVVPNVQALHMLRVAAQNNQNGTNQMPQKYLLRIYGTGVEEFVSHEKEPFWLSQLASLKIGSQIYGIFANGRLEEFLESTTLTSDIDKWMKLVKQKWVEIRRSCDRNAMCAKVLDSWHGAEQGANKLKAHVEKEASSPVVFTHNDLINGNILRLDSTGELVLTDYEYAGYNYRGFDIANHFFTWMYNFSDPKQSHIMNLERYPTVEQRHNFLNAYVQAKAYMDANVSTVGQHATEPVELCTSSLTEDQIRREVEILDREVASFALAPPLY
ncbi:hypothetical protein EV175_006228 [Coemansia sp. RSA 1933]|nr:hypothetical protein EV175_006228 [Coemansia sp. RSA 1933]